jgi:hypothetical protein
MNDSAYSDVRTAKVDRSLGRSFKIFFKVAGGWLFSFWVLTLLAGFGAFIVTVADIKQVDPAVWRTLLFMGLVLAPIAAFHRLRIQRDEFEALWDDKALIIDALNQIEEARAEAARLNIKGMVFGNDKQLLQWIEEVNNWRSETYEKVYQLHPAEAGNFNTLGLFDPMMPAGARLRNPTHQQQLLNLGRRINILGEIRDRWTTRR